MYRITPVEHVADKGVEVDADSLAELFAGAARGMFASMLDLDGLAPVTAREVRLAAPDVETLMVRWLQELIFHFEVEDAVFVAFTIQQVTGTELAAVAHGCPWPHDRPRTGAAVKAVTYYGLEVAPTAEGWRARIVFDV